MMRTAVAALAFGVMLVLPAAAVEPHPLLEASAVWTDEGKVDLRVTYEGGACEETDGVDVEAGNSFTDVVLIHTVQLDGPCTMNIVHITFEEAIAVQPSTERLAVNVLGENGRVRFSGIVEIGAGPVDAAE